MERYAGVYSSIRVVSFLWSDYKIIKQNDWKREDAL